MYYQNANKALLASLKDAPEIQALRIEDSKGFVKKPPVALLRQLAERLTLELWNRGFAISARTSTGQPFNQQAHDDWRATRTKPVVRASRRASDRQRVS